MNANEQKVLVELADHWSSYEGYCYSGFASLCTETGLDRKIVRRACRSLTRKGLAQFGRGLWTEDGEPAGSGYASTKDGAALAQTLPRECEGCGQNTADPPGRLCPGCEAYQEHQR